MEKGGRYLVRFPEFIYIGIQNQLKQQHIDYEKKTRLKKARQIHRRFFRLEATAKALHEKLGHNKNGSISFPLNEVVEAIDAEYKRKEEKKESTNQDTLKVDIRILVGQIKIVEQVNGIPVRQYFMITYAKGKHNEQYGYILPMEKS